MKKEDLVDAILAPSFPFTKDLVNFVRPAIQCLATPRHESPYAGTQPVGTSRIGGLPDLPAGVAWPHSAGDRLFFYAQINLAEVPYLAERHLLPKNGMLYFFSEPRGLFVSPRAEVAYNSPETHESSAVIYSEALPLPRRVPPEGGPFGTAGEADPPEANVVIMDLSFSELWMIPDASTHLIDCCDGWELNDLLHETIYRQYGISYDFMHHMFGYPTMLYSAHFELADCERIYRGIEWPMTSEIRSRMERDFDEWVLLFSINSEADREGVPIADMGQMRYMIRKNDLACRDFSKVVILFSSR